MRKFAAILAVLVLAGCGKMIDPGNVGVVVHTFGGGVDSVPVSVGWHGYAPIGTTIYEYPTYMQTVVLTKSSKEGSENNDEINVHTVEGQPISMDVSLSFELDPRKVPALYTTFRAELPDITHTYVKQTVRQALQEVTGSEPIADIIGPKKAELTTRTQKLISERLAPYGILIKQFTINELRPPASIVEAIAAKNAMQQQALAQQNQLEKQKFAAQGDSIVAAGKAKAALAEAEGSSRALLLTARAQAQANELLSRSVTPTLVEYEKAQRWDGELPTYTGGGVPFLSMPSKP